MSSRKETLVPVDWIIERIDQFETDEPDMRLVEVDIDPERYEEGHIPGAVRFGWNEDLQDERQFDVVSPSEFARLLGDHGISENTTVVLYGDLYNWFAAYAYWLFTYYGHDDVRLLDGGWRSWTDNNYPTTAEERAYTPTSYPVPDTNPSIRVDLTDVKTAVETSSASLIDVRAPPEYRGDVLAPPGWNENVQRGGHIPGAVNVPWSRVVDEDGRFKSNTELRELFPGIDSEEVIVYCRIGERSALTWVALHELLGASNVKHYYGSWVEWGNTVGAPIERQ